MMPDFGPVTAQMSLHIALMSAVAPALAAVIATRLRPDSTGAALIAATAALQIGVLWGWHLPLETERPMAAAGHWIMPITLLTAATGFWLAILRVRRGTRWFAVVMLLLTSKLFCLLGILHVLAPRVLYPASIAHGGGHGPLDPLADQELAGLLMLVACPVCYVLAGLRIAARWLNDLECGLPEPESARRVDVDHS
jgi:putative membrane protein